MKCLQLLSIINLKKVKNVQEFTYTLAVISTSRGIWTTNFVAGLVKHQWPLASWEELEKQENLPEAQTPFLPIQHPLYMDDLHGCKTLHLNARKRSLLNASDSEYLHRNLGIRWNDFVLNEEVRRKTGLPPVSLAICKQYLNWLGHICRFLLSRWV